MGTKLLLHLTFVPLHWYKCHKLGSCLTTIKKLHLISCSSLDCYRSTPYSKSIIIDSNTENVNMKVICKMKPVKEQIKC